MQANPQAEGGLAQGRRRLAPVRQVYRVHAGARFLGDDGEFLAQIHAVAKFLNGGMACAYHFGLGGRFQPLRQTVLADARTRRAQQFEQAAFAKQVQIQRVGMRGLIVAVAGLAGAGPIAVQAGQGLSRKNGPPGASVPIP